MDSFIDILSAQLINLADQPTFHLLSGDKIKTWTYKDLDTQARCMAAHIQALDGKGERILILMPYSLEYIAAFLGFEMISLIYNTHQGLLVCRRASSLLMVIF
jgi:acyl-CoA synthetase (AMP-forming)/AMP-acid ligase II